MKPLPRSDDSVLNMTPMIDIVFQLILFFLFSLRFKSLDWRIDTSLPKGYGPNFGPPVLQPEALRATLVRLDAEDPDRAHTKLKLAGREWTLPAMRVSDTAARDEMRDEIARAMHDLRSATSGKGQIDVPAPRGAAVPHGDAILVLDAFLKAEFAEVEFQGASMPMPRR
jgi:biopolymer transport protein ExbD